MNGCHPENISSMMHNPSISKGGIIGYVVTCSCGWKAIFDGLDRCRANIPEYARFTWCRTEEQAQIALDQHLLENPETLLSRQELIKDYSV